MANVERHDPATSRGTPASTESGRSLVKYLVGAGLGSRRHCAALVLSGYVSVNGALAESLMMPVAAHDKVSVDGRPITPRTTGYLYLLVNKPAGYLSTVRDDRGRRTVMDLVPRAQRVTGLVPAGRLDLDSTGLILLTDDGDLVNRITHPRYEIRKEYHARLDGVVVPSASRAFRAGIELPTGLAKAVALRRLADQPGFRYAVVLIEGKKREVRDMFRAVGRRVLELERVRIGNLSVDALEPGAVRALTAAELRGIRELTGLAIARPDRARDRATERPSRGGPGPMERGRSGPRPRRTSGSSWASGPPRTGGPSRRGAPSQTSGPRRRRR
jgi:pseudouridine synthase